MKKNVFISISTILFLSIFAITGAANANAGKGKTLKVDDAKVIYCEALPAPSTGLCEVTAGDQSLLIKGNVLGIDAVYQGGEVLVDATGLIQFVGCSSNRPPDLDPTSATRIECAEGVI